jgi:hypothetical protein
MASGHPDMPLCLIYALLFNAHPDKGMSRPDEHHIIRNPTLFRIIIRLKVWESINTFFFRP